MLYSFEKDHFGISDILIVISGGEALKGDILSN